MDDKAKILKSEIEALGIHHLSGEYNVERLERIKSSIPFPLKIRRDWATLGFRDSVIKVSADLKLGTQISHEAIEFLSDATLYLLERFVGFSIAVHKKRMKNPELSGLEWPESDSEESEGSEPRLSSLDIRDCMKMFLSEHFERQLKEAGLNTLILFSPSDEYWERLKRIQQDTKMGPIPRVTDEERFTIQELSKLKLPVLHVEKILEENFSGYKFAPTFVLYLTSVLERLIDEVSWCSRSLGEQWESKELSLEFIFMASQSFRFGEFLGKRLYQGLIEVLEEAPIPREIAVVIWEFT